MSHPPGTRFVLSAVAMLSSTAVGQSILINKGQEFEPKSAVAPFVFSNENLGFGAGPALVSTGHFQDQMSLLLGGFYTSNDSRSAFFFANDVKLPFGERLFLDARVSISKFREFESYNDGNPRYPFERAGSHDSNEDNFLDGEGEDDYFQFNFKYLLPMGDGRDSAINTYILDKGLLDEGATGGKGFNPWESGRTYLELEGFYRNQEVTSRFVDTEQRTNGAKFSLRYDNRDFAPNPSRGNMSRVSLTRDFGAFDSTGSWMAVDGEFTQYIPLGSSPKFRQIVLALNVWTSYSPTWGDEPEDGRPPLYAGGSLGGLDRMRGYPEGRYYDKAAIYYSAELRLIPRWNPFSDRLKWLEIDWIMFAPFVEIGRVADEWSIDTLHSDMNWSAGVGFRVMAKHLVLRIDTAYSPEGTRVQMMVQHPF